MIPAYLQPSDEIRIISPSGTIDGCLIEGAKDRLKSWGLKVTEGNYARSEYGRFAGTAEQRIADLQSALDDKNVKAILCSRGGYGLAQIIDKIDFSKFITSPKWLIGFSDITILHNVINNLNIASIHGIMAKHLTELDEDCEQVKRLYNILFGNSQSYSIPSHLLNRSGSAQGKIVGGNLSVLIGLRGSKFDLDYKNNILFIEDIAEKPYHIDRMMQNLRFSGVLAQLSGLIVGQFSDCIEDPSMKLSIKEMIANSVKEYNYPVCFDFPAGHVDYNLPLIMGEKAYLEVNESEVKLTF